MTFLGFDCLLFQSLGLEVFELVGKELGNLGVCTVLILLWFNKYVFNRTLLISICIFVNDEDSLCKFRKESRSRHEYINTSKSTNCLLRVRISALFAGRGEGGGLCVAIIVFQTVQLSRKSGCASVSSSFLLRYRGRERPAVDCGVGGGSAPSY